MSWQPSPPPPSRTPVLTALVVLLVLAAGGLLAAYPRMLHFSFVFSAYDVGMHLQALWKFSRLDGLLNTIRGLPYWGDHLWIAYALLAPVYNIWPTATVLYAYQGLGLAAGGLAVWGIARRRLASPVAALVPVVLYLCYPGLIYTAQENFHPEAIGSTWLLVVLWAQETGRRRLFWLAVALALATKEDIALYLIGFAAWIFLRGDRRRAVVLAGVCAVYFFIAMKVLLPAFNGVGFFRASGGYWFSALAANVMNPSWYAEVFARPVARAYAWDLVWPVAFLPLLSPVTLFLLAVPAFIVNNLAGGYLVSVHYHYMYGIIPGVFMATVEALATLEGLARRWLHPTWLRRAVGTIVLGLVLVPALRMQVGKPQREVSYLFMASHLRPYDSEKVRFLHATIARIGPEAKVAASHNLVPFLADRRWIFMFPNPWKVMYWGINGENQVPPETVDTLLLDLAAMDGELGRKAEEIIASGGWTVLAKEHMVLFAVRE